MIEEVILGQVKLIIRKAIKRFAKEQGCEPKNIGLLISAKDEHGTPMLSLLVSGKNVKQDMAWSSLMGVMDKVQYGAMGFDADRDMAKWISKFLVKAKYDCNLSDVRDAFYVIYLFGEQELRPMMYREGKAVNELPEGMFDKYKNVISIEYILQTK